MSYYEREYVSNWVPGNIQLLTVLLVAVAVVNSAIRLQTTEVQQNKWLTSHSI